MHVCTCWLACVCMYVCLHVCVHMCVHVLVSLCVHVCVPACVHVLVGLCVHECVHVLVGLCVHVLVGLCMCVCICVCMCWSACVCMQTHLRVHACMCVHANLYACVCVRAHRHVVVCAHVRSRAHAACVQACLRVSVHVCTHTEVCSRVQAPGVGCVCPIVHTRVQPPAGARAPVGGGVGSGPGARRCPPPGPARRGAARLGSAGGAALPPPEPPPRTRGRRYFPAQPRGAGPERAPRADPPDRDRDRGRDPRDRHRDRDPHARGAAPGSSHRRPGRTMALPRTLGELQLYRVLQRANLLSYYETFIQQGGDDVRQLCEAGEEEFLEIMALVGMAAKPLHVRRLQKALREWAAHPGLFGPPAPALPARVPPVLPDVPLEPRSPSPPSPEQDEEGSTSPGEPEALEPALVRAVAEGVERLLPGGPRAAAEPEPGALQRVGRRLARAVGHVFQMDDGDRRKAGEIRRLSAIYGRGEGRRREGRRLSLQELTINEAAAQFCLRDQSLLLRRVELFSLARQVARESAGLGPAPATRQHPEESGGGQAKRLKQEVGEQSRPEPPVPPGGPETYVAPGRAGPEDDGSLSGDSLDGPLQAGPCPQLTPPPTSAPDLPPHGLWSRHILQQTLMDEGLRLARLVSHERPGHLSPCLPSKAPGPELDNGLPERGAPAQPESRRSSIKVEPETSRQ
ncbi:NGFI-A-binding protein 2 isoform X2 [Alligator mississippiensis]|uniref:NGFI-A-binding protein 2 isoform X2 n=1 Tax=Alligator mississippiensis TaxID=8496 RepID=UPI002877FD08|nr:NGFI-A-binding protein 2 isoform X2 [Alligator mississippiensis]